MPLTPVEIRHVELRRAWLRGYRRHPVDQLLEEIADSFEEVWRERADLSDQLEELETETASTGSSRFLRYAVSASAQHRNEGQARRERLIVQEAHANRDASTREAAAERSTPRRGRVKIRSQLRAASIGSGVPPLGRRTSRGCDVRHSPAPWKARGTDPKVVG